ncbi:MAG: ABC-type transport auxiliary lipoprotein family protein [Planctomycetota bacterium JB042]
MTRSTNRTPRAAPLVLAALLPGCLSLPKGEAPPVRTFEPGLPAPAAVGSAPPAPFRLGRVSAAEHLRERLVWRAGDGEVGFYDDLRWTELPVRYLERALGDELHRRRAMPSEPPMAVLDVRLEAFEETLAPRSGVRVVVRGGVERRDGRRREVVAEVVRARPTDDPLEVGAALGDALVEAVRTAVAEAAAALR